LERDDRAALACCLQLEALSDWQRPEQGMGTGKQPGGLQIVVYVIPVKDG